MYQLAQVNVARMRGPLRATEMAQFAAALDPVNRIADTSPGFVWRHRSPDGHAAITRTDGSDLLVVNLSVWESYEALHAFVYRSVHGGFLRRRDRWFLPTRQPSTALWWTPEDTRPTVDEALRRLAVLRADGPSPRAFTVKRRFTPDGRPQARSGSRRRGVQ